MRKIYPKIDARKKGLPGTPNADIPFSIRVYEGADNRMKLAALEAGKTMGQFLDILLDQWDILGSTAVLARLRALAEREQLPPNLLLMRLLDDLEAAERRNRQRTPTPGEPSP